ncbi:MAG: sigma 54-interacting transcriptional regulator [Desulfobacterales bacterium]
MAIYCLAGVVPWLLFSGACIFANALARKRTEFELVKSEKRLRIEIDERKRAERMLQNRLEFDRLLSEASARFAMISPDRLDTEIESSLRQMLAFFKVDRCGMVRTLPGKKSFEIVYMAAAENIPPIPAGTELPRSINPWAYDTLTCKREVIAFSRMDDPPPEAAVDRQTWLTWGIRSHLAIPIILSDSTDWLISANLVKSERPWPEEIIQQFKLLGEILAGAIERNAADVALRESEERLNLAAAAAEAGLWIISAATWRIWATPKTRELFQFPTDEELSLERLLSVIHPDDRERVNSAVTHSLRHLETLQIIEYRVVLPDGGTRWMVSRGRSYPGNTGLADRIMGVTVDVTERKNMEETLQLKLKEIDALKLQLERENLYLREEIRLQHGHEEIVGRSDGMKQVLAKVEQVAGTDATVLLQGETGTGKELMAHAIHRLSTRRDRSLVAINCASLPPSLIESELFGREKGAFTGAMTRMAGRFEVADRSTFFLDEIGELSIDLQAKLLRVIEEGRFERLGSTKSIQVNVRIIAATNRDLAQEVAAGRFRQDLFYRLNVFPILIPPLRERAEDIPSLVWAFVKQYEKKMGKRVDHIPRKDMDALQRYPWPGNARELRNIVERAMIMGGDGTLRLPPPSTAPEVAVASGDLLDVERRHILGVLKKTGWRVTGKGGAAEILGLKRTTLQSKMKKLDIKRPPA